MTLKVVLRFAADEDGAKTTTVFSFDTLYWRHDDAMPQTPPEHFNDLNIPRTTMRCAIKNL